METQTAPRPSNAEMPQPKKPHVVLEGQHVDTGRFSATARVPQEGSYMPSMETRQPAPIKLEPGEAQKRITPLVGAAENWRGDPTITSAKSRLAVHQERISRSLTGNFAVRSLGKAVRHMQNKREQWKRERYWR